MSLVAPFQPFLLTVEENSKTFKLLCWKMFSRFIPATSDVNLEQNNTKGSSDQSESENCCA